MSIRKIGRFAGCLVLLAASPAAILYGQQPAQETVGEQVRRTALDALYAVQADRTTDVAADLLLGIAAHTNPVGIDVVEVGPALRAQLSLPEGTGVVVSSVKPDSEAAKAGLQQYDIVLRIDDQKIGDQKQFDELVTAQQGKAVEIHVLRGAKPTSVKVTLPAITVYKTAAEALAQVALDQLVAADQLAQAEQHYRIGVTLAEADDTLRSQLRLASGEGLVVTEVLSDSAAAKAGIQKHDVLVKLDGKRLTTVEAINAQIQEIKDRAVSVALMRAGAEVSLEVAPRLTTERSVRDVTVESLGEWVRSREALSRVLLTEQVPLTTRVRVVLQPHVVTEQVPVATRYEVSQPVVVTEVTEPVPVATKEPVPAAEQIAALKKQLAEIQKSLEALEASLREAPGPKK